MLIFKVKNIVYILFLIAIFFSCSRTKKNVYDDLRGDWAIHGIIYKNKDYKSHIYSINIFGVEENDKLTLPEVDNYKKDELAKWSFDYAKDSITFIIKSKNKIFEGVYNAQIFKLEATDKLILKSDDLYLELYKL